LGRTPTVARGRRTGLPAFRGGSDAGHFGEWSLCTRDRWRSLRHDVAGENPDGNDLCRRTPRHGASIPFDPTYEERGIYTVSGEIDIAGDRFGPGQLLVFRPGNRITIRATSPARLMLLGGEPMDGPRHIWWKFVSSRPERIEQAKADWKAAHFDSVPGETEFIPLPEPPKPQVASYP
jgi:hypothetical protein